jgi:hypothetical protein
LNPRTVEERNHVGSLVLKVDCLDILHDICYKITTRRDQSTSTATTAAQTRPGVSIT